MKRKHLSLISIILCVCCLYGCHNKKQVLDKPDNLINRNTMVKIIAECYIIESTVHTAPDSVNKIAETRTYYREMFNRYKITREQFSTSMDYYLSEQSTADKLLKDASDLIAKQRKELNITSISAPELANPTDIAHVETDN